MIFRATALYAMTSLFRRYSRATFPEGNVALLYRRNRDVIAYNAVARKIIEENRIAIDDLYAFALPRLKSIQKANNVHFTDTGSEQLAKQVAASILAALKV